VYRGLRIKTNVPRQALPQPETGSKIRSGYSRVSDHVRLDHMAVPYYLIELAPDFDVRL
jgi:hypothetical protein